MNDEGEADVPSKLSPTIVLSPRIEAESKSDAGSSQWGQINPKMSQLTDRGDSGITLRRYLLLNEYLTLLSAWKQDNAKEVSPLVR